MYKTKSAKDYKTAEGMLNYLVRMPTGRNRYACWTNVVKNDGALGSVERVYSEDSKNKQRTQARPEQKSVLLMQELVHRFSQQQDIVVELVTATVSTAVACMSMPAGGFRFFAGCELDETCWKSASDRIKKTFALEVTPVNIHGCTGIDRDSVKQEF